MLKRILVSFVVIALVSPSARLLAQEQRADLSRAAGAAVRATLAAESVGQRPAARGENPYMLPGLILLGGGATLSVLGFIDKTGVECTGDVFSVNCGTTSNKGLIFSGLAVAGVGAALLVVGEGKRGSPTITARPGGFVIRQQIRF